MTPDEPKPATDEARVPLHAAGRDWKTVDRPIINSPHKVKKVEPKGEPCTYWTIFSSLI